MSSVFSGGESGLASPLPSSPDLRVHKLAGLLPSVQKSTRSASGGMSIASAVLNNAKRQQPLPAARPRLQGRNSQRAKFELNDDDDSDSSQPADVRLPPLSSMLDGIQAFQER